MKVETAGQWRYRFLSLQLGAGGHLPQVFLGLVSRFASGYFGVINPATKVDCVCSPSCLSVGASVGALFWKQRHRPRPPPPGCFWFFIKLLRGSVRRSISILLSCMFQMPFTLQIQTDNTNIINKSIVMSYLLQVKIRMYWSHADIHKLPSCIQQLYSKTCATVTTLNIEVMNLLMHY